MTKQDIREYSEQELSLNVMNCEGLYSELCWAARRDDFSMIESLVEELFIYTEEQLDELREDFQAEVEEIEADENS